MNLAGRVVGYLVGVPLAHAICPQLPLGAWALIGLAVAAIVYRPCQN
jgi:hypothetical protein